MSTQVKTPDEVAVLARQLWALYREGHQETIQLWLTELVNRLRKDKPVVLVERQELSDIRAQLHQIEFAIDNLTQRMKPLSVKAMVRHSTRGVGMISEIDGSRALVNFGIDGRHWVERSDLKIAEEQPA